MATLRVGDADGFKALAADLARVYCSGSPSSTVAGSQSFVASPSSTIVRRSGDQRQRALMPRAEGAAPVVLRQHVAGDHGSSLASSTSYASAFDSARSRRELVSSFLGLDHHHHSSSNRRMGGSSPPPPPAGPAPLYSSGVTGVAQPSLGSLSQLHEQLARMRGTRQSTTADHYQHYHDAHYFGVDPTGRSAMEHSDVGADASGTIDAPPARRRQRIHDDIVARRAPETVAVPQSRVPSIVPGATTMYFTPHSVSHTTAPAAAPGVGAGDNALSYVSPTQQQRQQHAVQRNIKFAEAVEDDTPTHGNRESSVSPLTVERGEVPRTSDDADGSKLPRWTREASLLRRSEEPRHDAPPRPLAQTQRREETDRSTATTCASTNRRLAPEATDNGDDAAEQKPLPLSVLPQQQHEQASALPPRDRILGKIVDRVNSLQTRLSAQQAAVVRRHATQSLDADKVRRAAASAEYRLSESTVELETRLSQLQQRLQDRVATQRKLRGDLGESLAAQIRQSLHRIPKEVQQQAIRAVGTSIESVQLSAEALLTSLAQQHTHVDMQLSSLMHRAQNVQRQVREQLAAVHHVAVTRLLPSALEDVSTYMESSASGAPEVDLSHRQPAESRTSAASGGGGGVSRAAATYSNSSTASRPRVGGAKTLKTMFDTLTQFLHQSRWQLDDLRRDRIAFEEHFIGRIAVLASQSPRRAGREEGE